jgi:hypothetical protein
MNNEKLGYMQPCLTHGDASASPLEPPLIPAPSKPPIEPLATTPGKATLSLAPVKAGAPGADDPALFAPRPGKDDVPAAPTDAGLAGLLVAAPADPLNPD